MICEQRKLKFAWRETVEHAEKLFVETHLSLISLEARKAELWFRSNVDRCISIKVVRLKARQEFTVKKLRECRFFLF